MYAPLSRNVFWIYGALQIKNIISMIDPKVDVCSELVALANRLWSDCNDPEIVHCCWQFSVNGIIGNLHDHQGH